MLTNRPDMHNQQGFTLLELIVVTPIMIMAIVLLGQFSVRTMDSYRYQELQATAANDVQGVIERTGRVVRGTTDVVTAQSNTLTIYAYFSPADAVVKKVRYFVDGTTLKVGITPPTGTAPNYTYDPAQEQVKVMLSNLTTSPQPVFRYYDDLGNQLTGTFTVNQVKQVGIYLSTNPNTRYMKAPVSTETRVTLRNKKTNL